MKFFRMLSVFATLVSGQAFSTDLVGWSALNPQIWQALTVATGSTNLTSMTVQSLDACRYTEASRYIDTDLGSFYSCGDDFEGTVAFLPQGLDEDDAIVLGRLNDGRVGSFGTREVFWANGCEEVYSQVGEDCFSKIAGKIAGEYVPNFSSDASDVMLASYITSTFSPIEAKFNGEVSMCYQNTGVFSTKGFNSAASTVAKEQRDSRYAACENTEGNSRYWASLGWSNIAVFGAVAIMIPTTLVGCIPIICCGGCAAKSKSS